MKPQTKIFSKIPKLILSSIFLEFKKNLTRNNSFVRHTVDIKCKKKKKVSENWNYNFKSWITYFHLCFNILYFLRAILGSQQNLAKDRFLINSLPLHIHSLPISTIPHQSGTSVTTDEFILILHYYPKFIVYIMINSWCIFYDFGQIHQDMFLPL